MLTRIRTWFQSGLHPIEREPDGDQEAKDHIEWIDQVKKDFT